MFELLTFCYKNAKFTTKLSNLMILKDHYTYIMFYNSFVVVMPPSASPMFCHYEWIIMVCLVSYLA